MTTHVLEHLALTLVLAPALAAGWVVAVRVPAPVALLQFAVVAGLSHVPTVWNATQREVALRVAVDLAVLGSAFLFWRPALAPDSPFGPVGRALYALAGMPAMSYVGVLLYVHDRPLYRGVSLAAQQRAGAIMWGVGSAVAVLVLVAAVWSSLLRDERRVLAREALGR